jgi:RimJ/RimL family protein N-acetyltransferase
MIWQPTLAADAVDVVLHPLREADRDALFAVAADPLIWAQHPAHDRWQQAVFDRFFDEALESGGALAVRHAATGALLGSSRFDERRAGADEVEIGWTFLARSQWGAATNAAVKRLMVGYALEHRAGTIFIVGEGNARSRRALAKIGATQTDRTLLLEMAGAPVRHMVYVIDRASFRAGPLVSVGA